MEINNIEMNVTGAVMPPCLTPELQKYAPEKLDTVTTIEYDDSGGFFFGLEIHVNIEGRFGREPNMWC